MDKPPLLLAELRHRHIETNGIRLHVVETGPREGPLLIFLHGFPEFWRSWRYQMAYFAQKGFHVLAPDQRGYNLSDKPRPVSAYRIDVLARDILGLMDVYDQKKAFVAGHDWGAAVGWWLGMQYPDRLKKLALLNVPHPAVMKHHLWHNPQQRRKSGYIFFFQLPWIPEWRMRRNNWEMAAKALERTSKAGTFSEEDLQAYRQAWAQPGAATAMINWYRAALRHQPSLSERLRVTVPVLLIWGARDRFLGREMARPSIELCDAGKLVFMGEATHWVHHEYPEKVNALLAEFWGEPAETGP